MTPLKDKPHITWPLIAALTLTYAAILGWYFWPQKPWMAPDVRIQYIESGYPMIEYSRIANEDVFEAVYVAEMSSVNPDVSICVSNKAPFSVLVRERTEPEKRQTNIEPPKGYKYFGLYEPHQWMRNPECDVNGKPGRYEILGRWCRHYYAGECIDPVIHEPLAFEVREAVP